MLVSELMTRDPMVLHPNALLKRAAAEMETSQIRHLPVVDHNRVLLGIVSQRDVLAAGSDLQRRVGDVMVTDVKSIGPDLPAHEAAYLVLRYVIGCVPVTDEAGVLLGIITDTDFVRVAYQLLGGRVSVDEIEREEREADRV